MGTIYREPQPLQGKGSRELRPVKTNWWLIGAVVVFVAGALWVAMMIFHSNEQPPVAAIAGTSQRSLALSSDGKLLASGALDGTLRVFSTENGRMLAMTRLATGITALTFGPGDTLFALDQGDSALHIFSGDLNTHTQREVQPHPHDLAWSQDLDGAIVISAGADEVHPKLEIFPAHPMGIVDSTVQLYDLRAWSSPHSVAVNSDGTRIAISIAARKNNLILYDPKVRRIASVLTIDGTPQGMTFSAKEDRLWVASPTTETITEITPRTMVATAYPKGASTSPPAMIAVNEAARRAYTSGSLTFPEVDLDQNKIVRTVELPFRSAAIVLSPDGKTAYVSADDQNRIGLVDVQNMKYLRDITWVTPSK